MITLTAEEELGLKLIALMRDGKIKGFQCSDCRLQEQRNCAGAEEHSIPVLHLADIGDIYVCPIILIPNNIRQFIDEYDYYEKYPSAVPKYGEVNPRFWEAVKFLEQYKISISKDEDKPKADTKGNMDKMKNFIKMR